jgi:hypothetical protein
LLIMRLTLLAALAVVSTTACTPRNPILATMPGDPDGGSSDTLDTRTCSFLGRTIPVGMRFAIGGNEGFCYCNGSVCEATATTAALNSDAGYLPLTCTETSSCGRSRDCYFDEGCSAPQGHCAYVASSCGSAMGDPLIWDPNEAAPPAFCGCDGVTYRGAAQNGDQPGTACPFVPYRHVGPCE